jgi:beta-N-acetylhexosaminidase
MEGPPQSPGGEGPPSRKRPILPWHWHRRWPKMVLAAILILAIGGALASILLQNDDDESSGTTEVAAKLPAEVERVLEKMRAADKVDTVLLLGFSSPAQAEKLLGKAELGGVFVDDTSWPGGGAGKDLTSRLRAAGSGKGRVPPLIATRQEGGDYRSLDDLPPGENELQIGDTGKPRKAEAWALKTGRSLSDFGFDLNLAPVADVATIDSAIADRAFGDESALVAQMTVAAVRGCERSGVACAVSHFPGQGGASADTADGPATVGLDQESLRSRDLVPFRSAFRAKVPAVLVSLAVFAAFDPVTPAALSPDLVDDLLRDDLGFRGVAISDDLSFGAIAAGQGAAEAAQAALAAGVDLILVSAPGAAAKARAGLLKAVQSGAVPEERLDEAAGRVLTLKRRLGLLPGG